MQNCSWDSNVMLNVLVAFVRSRELYGTNDTCMLTTERKRKRNKNHFCSIFVYRAFSHLANVSTNIRWFFRLYLGPIYHRRFILSVHECTKYIRMKGKKNLKVIQPWYLNASIFKRREIRIFDCYANVILL